VDLHLKRQAEMTDVAESPNFVLFLFSVEVELVAAYGAVVKEMKL
jgi:hypothetical protein